MSWRRGGDKEISEEKILREEKQKLEQVSQKLLRTKDALTRIDESILHGIVGGGASTNLYGGNDDDR